MSIFWIFFGALLFIIGTFDGEDPFWSGMGGGLIAVGIIQLIKQIKYRTDEKYREKVDITQSDERYKFLQGRAWALSGYIFVIVMAMATVGLKLAGYDEFATFSGIIICFMALLYAVIFHILEKKY